jgi:PAS fold
VTLGPLIWPAGLMQDPRGVVIFDTDLRIAWANPAAGRLGEGMPVARWPGRRLGEVLPGLDVGLIEGSLRRVLAGVTRLATTLATLTTLPLTQACDRLLATLAPAQPTTSPSSWPGPDTRTRPRRESAPYGSAAAQRAESVV